MGLDTIASFSTVVNVVGLSVQADGCCPWGLLAISGNLTHGQEMLTIGALEGLWEKRKKSPSFILMDLY